MPPSIATADRPDREQLVEFLRQRRQAVVTTRRKDGRLQSSPVTCGVDSSGRLVVSTYPARAKARNVARDSRVSVCMLSENWDGPYVQVDGTAEVLGMPEALDPLVEYYRALAGEHADWEDYKKAMIAQDKCLIRITIDDWGPIATGGFPPDRVPG